MTREKRQETRDERKGTRDKGKISKGSETAG
jgi:hypothetical protein